MDSMVNGVDSTTLGSGGGGGGGSGAEGVSLGAGGVRVGGGADGVTDAGGEGTGDSTLEGCGAQPVKMAMINRDRATFARTFIRISPLYERKTLIARIVGTSCWPDDRFSA
jgi:hypothetical protein